MIDFGLKKSGMPGWRNQKNLNDETLKTIYGQQALQYFNQKNLIKFI